jgi:hypothetical protein
MVGWHDRRRGPGGDAACGATGGLRVPCCKKLSGVCLHKTSRLRDHGAAGAVVHLAMLGPLPCCWPSMQVAPLPDKPDAWFLENLRRNYCQWSVGEGLGDVSDCGTEGDCLRLCREHEATTGPRGLHDWMWCQARTTLCELLQPHVVTSMIRVSAGYVLECAFPEPVLWAQTSLPEAVVQPTLPDGETGQACGAVTPSIWFRDACRNWRGCWAGRA